MKKIYLLTTEHFEKCLWFRGQEDFKVAMNYVAVQAASNRRVVVLAFILMSNHVHFVLKGTYKDVIEFINGFKQRYSLYYRRKYGVKEFLRGNKVDIQEISYYNESIEKTIAYVQMNSVAANICSHATQYPWGTGNTFFNSMPAPLGKKFEKMSARAKQRALKSECKTIPDDWQINDSGYVFPEYYVDVDYVETRFKTPQRMNYFLTNSSKAKKKSSGSEPNLPSFRDQTILQMLPDLLDSLYNKQSFKQLNPEEQVDLARQIKYRFSSDVHQIGRVCGISYSDAARLLDSI